MSALERQVQQLKTEGKAALARHDFEGARDVLSQAIALNASSHKLFRLRSVAYACLQEYTASLEDAEKVISLQPNSTDGYYHKGFALYHQKDYSGAAHAFQEGLKLNPSDRVLRQGFWDAVTLLSQHRVCLPMRYQVAEGKETEIDLEGGDS
mmetsp:Transcript_31135/g.37682  ORF Transcript_31135/g.37682 Transcript_31135/m.37682 type:complete len:152 (-) Transcript_31135:273-728(-)|eukprot:CAMPEP_0197850312 /NCGR_PEP_ID=MMETSP1438-20131217/14997_1 /TAXON_ID=1461541 /ORGANISM="Pterosperma sp., Strain CCMP1384" /LENGTH=151 /DNA_ID=CAMNT_0043463421 /DNA_START=311 /DNA_END=766 /DNA_ORIENTATION=+